MPVPMTGCCSFIQLAVAGSKFGGAVREPNGEVEQLQRVSTSTTPTLG